MSQIMVSILKCANDGTRFNFKASNREAPALVSATGKVLQKLFEETPNGVLVFFPSYRILDFYRMQWENEGTLKTLGKLKSLFSESTKA